MKSTTVTSLYDADAAPLSPPPANTEAEQALLGAILVNNAAYGRVADFLLPEHFANAVHGRIFAAIGRLIGAGAEANPVTLKNLFEQDSALAEIGGTRYLARLAESAVTIINAEYYGRSIVDLAHRRALMAACEDAIACARSVDIAQPALVVQATLESVLSAASARHQIGGELEEWDAGDDDEPIPPREWLLGNVFCRQFGSSLVAGGGTGKTTVRIAQVLSLASGRPLTDEHVFCRCRVLYVCLEDGRDELRRRIRAACLHHQIAVDDLRGWLFLAAPLNGAKLAVLGANGAAERGALLSYLVKTIKRRQIDLVCIDPLKKAHGLEENDNNAMDFVVGLMSRLAIEYNIAVDLPHHVSKGALEPGNADRGRGAGAIKDGERLVYTLSGMSQEEARALGISDEERRFLIRTDSAKVNIAPPARRAKWFKLVGVSLGNGTSRYPRGDEVQTVEVWNPPDFWSKIPQAVANAILDQIDRGLPNGQRYSPASQAADRAAWRAVQEAVPDLPETQARAVIKTWLANAVVLADRYLDPITRKEAACLTVNPAKRPG